MFIENATINIIATIIVGEEEFTENTTIFDPEA